MPQRIRDEFRLKNVRPYHGNYASFTTSKWMSTALYLVYRWVAAIFMSVSLLYNRFRLNRWYSSAFTMWGLVTLTLYFDLSAILCSIQYYLRKHSQSCSIAVTTTEGDTRILNNQADEKDERHKEVHPKLVRLHQFMWILFNIAAVNSMIVTIGYWGLLHNKFGQRSMVGQIGYINITSHLMNGMLILVDAILNPLPVRILHIVYSSIYGFIYVLATVVHWLLSGKTRKFYEFLDYSDKPGLAAITVVLCFLVVQPLFQLFFYAVYRCREWLIAKCVRNNQDEMREAQYVA